MSTREVRRFGEHMKAEANEKSEGGSSAKSEIPKEMTQAEYDRLAASMKANAEAFGRRRN